MIILAAAVVALSLYLVLRKTDLRHYPLPGLPSLDKARVTRVTLIRAEGAVTLARKDKRWVLQPGDYPADPDAVDGILAPLGGLTLTAMVSESRNYGLYDLTPAKRVTLECFEGDRKVLSLGIGKAASTGRHVFVLLEGDPRVYQLSTNLRDAVNRTPDELRDRSVLSFDQAEITEIRLDDGKTPVCLVREGRAAAPAPAGAAGPRAAPSAAGPAGPTEPATGTPYRWKTPDGREADTARVDGWLASLANLVCEGYLEGRKKEDFAAQAPVFTITLQGARTYTLVLYTPEGGNHPAVSSGSAYPFQVPSWQAERLIRKPEDLLAPGQP